MNSYNIVTTAIVLAITFGVIQLFWFHIQAAFSMFYNDIFSHINDTLTKKVYSYDRRDSEYIFVDFNVWEYCSSDELWTGIIRNLYEKVELRMSKKIDKSSGISSKRYGGSRRQLGY